jgi:myo-inositol-1(or 4)-monophosphatase
MVPAGNLTTADIASEQTMLRLLQTEAPEVGVLSEESGFQPGGSVQDNDVWVLDPLDGTVNYVTGLDDFGVIVGLTRKGSPVLGGMYLPVTDDLYLAARGQGATHNGAPISVSSTQRVDEAVFDHSLAHLAPILEAQDLTLQSLIPDRVLYRQ